MKTNMLLFCSEPWWLGSSISPASCV